MDVTDSRVLMTGGAGFIGSHIADELRKVEYGLTIFDNLSTGRMENIKPSLSDAFVRGNIQDFVGLRNIVKDVDVVIHCAAQVSTFAAIDNPVLDFNINALGTFNLFEACRQVNDKAKIIYTSSRSVYGNVSEPNEADENTPTNPMNSFYPLHKLYGEQLAKLYHELYGMNYVILRPANVVGSRQPNAGSSYNFISYWASRILRGKPIPIYRPGTQVRDYVDVRDVARAYKLCMENDKALNEMFLLAGGKVMTLEELANRMQDIANIWEKTPTGLKQKHVGINYLPERKGDIMRFVGNSDKARDILGWHKEYSSWTTLADTIDYVRQNLGYYDKE